MLGVNDKLESKAIKLPLPKDWMNVLGQEFEKDYMNDLKPF